MGAGSGQRTSQPNSNAIQQSSSRQSQSQPQSQPRQPQVSVSVAGVSAARSANDHRPNLMPPELGSLLEMLTNRLGRPSDQPSGVGEGSQGSASMAGDGVRTDRQQQPMMPPQLLQFFSRLSTAGVSFYLFFYKKSTISKSPLIK